MISVGDNVVYARISAQEFSRIFAETLAGCNGDYYVCDKWSHFHFSDGSKIAISDCEIIVISQTGTWIAYLYLP